MNFTVELFIKYCAKPNIHDPQKIHENNVKLFVEIHTKKGRYKIQSGTS